MANDNVYIVCVGCGKSQHLDKYYPSRQLLSPSDQSYYKPDRVAAFMEQHVGCSPAIQQGDDHLGDAPLFVIAPESWIDPDTGTLQGKMTWCPAAKS